MRAWGCREESYSRSKRSYAPDRTEEGQYGYLPGGDHSITTIADETLEGLKAAIKVIRHGGIVTVVLYDGHEAGSEEKKSVLDWAGALDAREYHAAYVNLINQPNHPPEILWITKK